MQYTPIYQSYRIYFMHLMIVRQQVLYIFYNKLNKVITNLQIISINCIPARRECLYINKNKRRQ